MNEKLFKYLRILLLVLLITTMIGLYFIQSAQFEKSAPILDILVPGFPRVLNWVALVFLASGWIVWEFAYSKSGNKTLGYISAGLIFISLFLTFNLLSFIAGSISVILIVALSVLFLPKVSEKKLAESLRDNKNENDKRNKQYSKIIKK